MQSRLFRTLGVGILFLVALVSLQAHAQAADATAVAAQWKPQELDFDLMEFTAEYSCQGLHGKMQLLLQALGAQPGAELVELGCMEPGFRGTRMPTVKMRFASLHPADGSGPQRGAWKSVNLVGIGKFDNTECELLEAVSRQVLPRFTVRNVQDLPPCFPHTQTLVPSFKLEVFAPVGADQARTQ